MRYQTAWLLTPTRARGEQLTPDNQGEPEFPGNVPQVNAPLIVINVTILKLIAAIFLNCQ